MRIQWDTPTGAKVEWETLTGVGAGSIVLRLYEPRWHGFAVWELEQRVPMHSWFTVLPIKRGWWRPPRSWKYKQFVVSGPDNGESL